MAITKDKTGVIHFEITTGILPVKSGETVYAGGFAGVKDGFLYNCISTDLSTYNAVVVVLDETANLDRVTKATTADGNVAGGKDNVGIRGDRTARLCLLSGVVEVAVDVAALDLAGKTAYCVDNSVVTADNNVSNLKVGKFIRPIDTTGSKWLITFDWNLFEFKEEEEEEEEEEGNGDEGNGEGGNGDEGNGDEGNGEEE